MARELALRNAVDDSADDAVGIVADEPRKALAEEDDLAVLPGGGDPPALADVALGRADEGAHEASVPDLVD